MQILLFALVLLAGLSPLLTFARLWQLKEWRWDRLREHLRHEGWCSQIFGWVRPTVIASGLVLFGLSLLVRESLAFDPAFFLWGAIAVLAWFTLFRFVVGKQSRPVWTQKSVTVVTIAGLLFFGASRMLLAALETSFLLGVLFFLLPLFPFLFVISVVIFLSPLDRFLKSLVKCNCRLPA